MTREEALSILKEYTKSESLLKHAFAVEAAMRAYARKFGEDEELWGVVGLLHDFDYEKFPDEHPMKGNEILKDKGVPEEIRTAILGHASYTGVPRETLMARALFAVDELCGFLVAVTLVRPNKSIGEVKVKSVKKKLKDKSFAAKVNRDEIKQGFEELGVPFEEHVEFTLKALSAIAPELGLNP
ncbi:HD domain-containing protein [Caldithrix abyssi]|uniref:HDIG domain-containing protein n=1 Tax=Caldithrix abyssi DSM 13497 TaxID=880073 RepID=H1XU94_CALAY|nr:HD domain-containing protein [Caldithrix abyssi]APF17484.1 HDIG domain-containing protein [Caldithrix abyssi DSM 13497]EHO41584.1 metal dependent phosphohydrolase [Caldithrix abyssi DSM 13497]